MGKGKELEFPEGRGGCQGSEVAKRPQPDCAKRKGEPGVPPTADKIEKLMRIMEEFNERLTALEKKNSPCCVCKKCGKRSEDINKCFYCSQNICENCASTVMRTDETIYYYCRKRCFK